MEQTESDLSPRKPYLSDVLDHRPAHIQRGQSPQGFQRLLAADLLVRRVQQGQ